MGVELDKWIEKVKRCEYLAEDELKALCEYVRLWSRRYSMTFRCCCMLRPPCFWRTDKRNLGGGVKRTASQ